MATETLSVKITANASSFSSALNQMNSDLSKMSSQFSGLNKLGDGMKSVGKKLTMGLTVPIAGMGAVSANTAMNFEAGMNKVSAISGATGKDLDKLSNLAKEMGAKTKFSASESAEALSYMGMAGWKTQDMLNGLPGILNLAAAGGTDLALTSDIVTDGLTALGLTASDTEKFVGIMAATVSNSNTNIELMGETLKYVGPVAGSLGIEMNDLSLAIGLMGNSGIKGSQAGTALRAGLTNLVKPTKEMKVAMEKYGVELVKNSDGSVNLMGTMDNLRSTLGGLDQATQAQALATIFGKEAMSGWAAIVNASEGDFNKLQTAISNSDGAAQNMSDTMMKGAQGALTEMKSALEGVAITIGERLTPFIEKLADWISSLCSKFQELSPATQTLIMIIAGVVAAIGPLLVIGGSLIKGFAALKVATMVLGVTMSGLCLPILGVIAAITAVIGIGVLLCQNWDNIKAFASECWSAVTTYVSEAWNNITQWISQACSNISQWVSETWNSICEWTSNTWTSICDWVSNAWDNICNVIQVGIMLIGEIISAAFQIITLPFQFIWQNCSDFLISIWNNITSFLSSVWNNISSACSSVFNAIATFLSGIWSSISSACSSVWSSITSYLSGIWSSISSACSSVFNSIKNFIQTVWNGVKSVSSSVWNSIKGALNSTWNSITSTATTVFNGLKSSISGIWNSIKSTTSSVWNSIKTAISTPINSAKDAVSKAIDKMKGFLNITLPFPKIKLPHFSFSGKFSLNPPSVPHFSVNWYSKGAIFKRPTVMGGIGVGDRHNGIGSNAEAILPINKLPELLGLDKQNNSGNLSLNIENFNNNREQDIKDLVEEIAFFLKKKNIAIGG